MLSTVKVLHDLVEKTVELYGKIDILINNAGITRMQHLSKWNPTDFQHVLNVNLTGVFNCTQAVVPYMLEKGAGKIINTSSVVVFMETLGKQIMPQQKQQLSE